MKIYGGNLLKNGPWEGSVSKEDLFGKVGTTMIYFFELMKSIPKRIKVAINFEDR